MRVSKQAFNRRVTPLGMDDQKLILALERKRTEVIYGCAHYCCTHKTLVDADHIDLCSHINNSRYRITEITRPLDGLKSILYMDSKLLTEIRGRLTTLKKDIAKLCESKVYVIVHVQLLN